MKTIKIDAINDDLSYLEDCAKKATKGDWIAVGTWVENTNDNQPDIVCTPYDFDRGPRDNGKKREADAEYIAAAQPKVIKSLISHIRCLRLLLDNAT